MNKSLLLLLFLSNLAIADSTIYLVRHAEKITTDGIKNPDLNAIGKFRAENIAKQLSQVGITEIYSSNFNRTMQTAKPLADFLNLEIQSYNPKHLAEFAKHIKSKQRTVLIVGHSDTTPKLTSLISNQMIAPIQENEYDNLYQIIISDTQTILTKFKSIPSYFIPPPQPTQSKLKINKSNKTIKFSLPNQKINHEN